MTEKKRRAFNFAHDELEALVVAVDERKSTLFGKFSASLTSQVKEKKWQEVAEIVSAVCGVQRTADSIKKKWSAVSSEAKARGALLKRDQAKTGAGVSEVKLLTSLEEKVLAVMGALYTEGVSTGTDVGLEDEIPANKPALAPLGVELCDSSQVILTLMDAECDSRSLPPAIIPSPARKKTNEKEKTRNLQEEFLQLEKEKLDVMKEQLNIERERLQLENAKFEFFKEHFKHRRDEFDLCELCEL